MKVGIVRPPLGNEGVARQLAPLFSHLEKRLEVHSHVITGTEEPKLSSIFPNLNDLHVLVVFPNFTRISSWRPMDWAGFTGRRVWLEYDVVQNYSTIAGKDLLGAFSQEFFRHRFDQMIVSGNRVCERLNDEGIPSSWVPTAIDPDEFVIRAPSERSGIVHYGTRYPSRRVMLSRLSRAEIAIKHVWISPPRLPKELSRYLAGVCCDMQASVPFWVPDGLFRYLPRWCYKVETGLEPMIKQYEIAAAGCTPVLDWQPDRDLLGWIDGVNCIMYRTMDELVQRLAQVEDDELMRIGQNARQFVVERHTWSDRAERLVEVLKGIS